MKLFVAPPLLDYQELLKTCIELAPHCAGFHFDIMDGFFVQETRFTLEDINKLRKETVLKKSQFWLHFMVANPIEYIKNSTLKPGDIISFHYEALHTLAQKKSTSSKEFFVKDFTLFEEIVELLEHKNIMPSLAVNPETPVKSMLDVLFLFEHILMMGVHPGKSGQLFIQNVSEKINLLRAYTVAQEMSVIIALDGGVEKSNLITLQNLDINEIAITSAIFNSKNPLKELIELNTLIQNNQDHQKF